MTLITKLMKKKKCFLWNKKCQQAWEFIKQKYVETLKLIFPNWKVEFHVHTNASSLLVKGAILVQNLTREHDQFIVYASRLLNNVKHNYCYIEHEALAMVFVLHKFKHYLVVFYVDDMALVYLMNKPQVLECIARWLVLFLDMNSL